MKIKPRIETMGEVAVGAALLIAVGWFLARAAQMALNSSGAIVSPAGLTQPNTTQLDGQSYFWPGPYTGSAPSFADTGATTAGLTPITIPNLPVSAPYFGPTTGTAPTSTSNASCGCATGYIGAGANFNDQSALPYSQDSFGSNFIGGALASPITAPPATTPSPAPASKTKQVTYQNWTGNPYNTGPNSPGIWGTS